MTEQAAEDRAQLDAPLCRYTQEVRFAVVLYGGVSLAIYINGIAQELLHLVRASAPAEPSASLGPTTRAWLEPGRLAGTEVVYRKLAQHISSVGLQYERSDDSPLLSRFVVDILSGSSAGGINAIVLGKALANDDESMQPIHDLWISEGDIAKLINDRESLAGLDGLKLQCPRRSVLNSERMYCKLLDAFEGMDARAPLHGAARESHLVDELDCWITTTDLHGLVVSLRLADEVVEERRYRNVYRFVYRSSHAGGTGTGVESDFERRCNPFLAFAARCTSSFPGAFDPMRLKDIDHMVDLASFAQQYGALTSVAPEWTKFIPAYLPAEKAPDGLKFRQRSFSDGGILDNKPFTWATATLARRRADLPVDRRLIYLEPSPDPVGATSAQRPDLVHTVLSAFTLPREQTIREDLDQVRRRNQELLRLRDALAAVEDAVVANPYSGMVVHERGAWLDTPLQQLVAERGLQWAAYHRMHVDQVLDDLGELVTRGLGFEVESGGADAVRLLAQVWFGATYETETNPEGARQAAFLSEFSLGYRLRRLRFLDKRIERFLTAADVAAAVQGFKDVPSTAGWEADFVDALWKAKHDVNDILVALRQAGRTVRGDAGLHQGIAALGFASSTDLTGQVLGATRTPQEALDCARKLVADRQLMEPLRTVAAAVAQLLVQPLTDAGVALGSVVAVSPNDSPGRKFALNMLRYYVDAYEDYDAVILPVSYGASGESGYVEVTRISPQSATALIDQAAQPWRHKLGGDQFGHFGGFFSAQWRCNDMMWGRLDAAERLIETLLPWDGDGRRDELVTALVREAQIAILHEERAAVFPTFTGTDEQLYDHVRNDYTVDLNLDAQQMMATAERGLAVTSVVFDDMAKEQGASAVARAGSSLFGRLLSGAATALAHATANLLAAGAVLVAAVFGIAMSTDITWLAWVAGIVFVLGVAALAAATLLRRRVAKALTPVPPVAPPAPPAPPPAAS